MPLHIAAKSSQALNEIVSLIEEKFPEGTVPLERKKRIKELEKLDEKSELYDSFSALTDFFYEKQENIEKDIDKYYKSVMPALWTAAFSAKN